MQCIIRASEVDTNPDYDIPKFYETLVSISISQHPVLAGAPQIKDATTATAFQARTIRQQHKGSKGVGKKGKSGKESYNLLSESTTVGNFVFHVQLPRASVSKIRLRLY